MVFISLAKTVVSHRFNASFQRLATSRLWMMPGHQLSTKNLSNKNKTRRTKRERERRGSQRLISAFSSMTQPAILSLTLHGILTTVPESDDAKDTVNIDDFLTNLWASDEDKISTIAATTGSISPLHHNQDCTLSCTTLCQKTMDEVWPKIQREQTLQNPQTQQSSFEEITLEEFLVKTGAVKEGHNSCFPLTRSPQWSPGNNSRVQNDGEEMVSNHELELRDKNNGNLMFTKSGPSFEGVHHGEGENMRVVGFGAQQLEMGSPVSQISISTASTCDHSLFGREEVGGRCKGKRGLNDMIGRVMERRKRRMIKNRESAARSRARKRAYTLELEVEVNQLKEENALLQEDKQRFREETRHLV